jgi:hypothetical protein
MTHFTDALILEADATGATETDSSTLTGDATKRCRHCNQYFTRYQIGGHEANCRKRLGITPGEVPYRLYLKNSSDYVDLDITVDELNAYRETHPVCEICGKSVSEVTKWDSKFAAKNLCVDHDHTTGKFRGLLCQICNRQLGWYENNKEKINKYLDK